MLGPGDTVKALQRGFGGILNSTGITVDPGAMLCSILFDSGGADRIARVFTRDRAPAWISASICAALTVGLPYLFGLSFVVLVPLVNTVAARAGSACSPTDRRPRRG